MSRTSKSVVITLIVAVVVAVLGLIYASPYIALDRLKPLQAVIGKRETTSAK